MNLNFLFAAFTLIWLCIVLFLLRLAKKIKALENQLQQMQDR